MDAAASATHSGIAEPARPGVPGGPLPLTMRGAGLAAALVLVVGLGVSLLLPVAAAIEARRVVPPGAVVVGRASFLPADGWVVTSGGTGQDEVVVSRAGTQMLVRYQGSAADPVATLRRLLGTAASQDPDLRTVGGARTFTTPSQDAGVLQPFASAGSTGAVAVVGGEESAVLVEAVGPATSFAPLFGQVGEMVTGIRLQEGGA
jgi:hypothetical protein